MISDFLKSRFITAFIKTVVVDSNVPNLFHHSIIPHRSISEERHVSKETLRLLCELDWVHEWVKVIDYSVYQMLIDIVMPDVLHPIPGKHLLLDCLII